MTLCFDSMLKIIVISMWVIMDNTIIYIDIKFSISTSIFNK